MAKHHGNKPVSVRRGMGLMLLIGGMLVAVLMAAITIYLAIVIRDRANEHFNGNTSFHSGLLWDDNRRIWEDDSTFSPEEREALYYNALYQALVGRYLYYENTSVSYGSFLPAEEWDHVSPEPIDGEYFVLVADPEGNVLIRQNSYFTLPSKEGAWGIIVELPEDFDQTIEEGANSIAVDEAVIEGVMISSYRLRLTKLASMENGEEKILYQGEVGPDEQVETFTDDFLIIYEIFPPTSAFTVHGVQYKDLEEYAMSFLEKYNRTKDATESSMEAHIAHYGLWQMVSIGLRGVPSLTADEYNQVVYVARCSPILAAAKSLRWYYAAACAAWVIYAAAVRKRMRKRLLRQLGLVTEHMQGGSKYFYNDPDATKGFREAEELIEGYQELMQKQRMDQNEITRLNTALDYAKEAEARRRAMTSAIAHELKTPLAVVHGYAEGLKENIAADKQETYLQTILSETERMDAMVLEMLDLSRLESGRVKLARDETDLAALVSGTVEKLQPLAAARGLTFEMDAPETLPVIADEARIAQVIENFCSNAVRYAKEGTAVHVMLGYGDAREVRTVPAGEKRKNQISFVIENETDKPLSGEELARVWETFYRTDKARSEKGTGLGLAIAKNIIELHGGTVQAENTKDGVRFSFTILK